MFNVVGIFIWGVIYTTLAYETLRLLNRKQGIEG